MDKVLRSGCKWQNIMLIIMIMLILLFLLSKTQNYIFLLSLYQQETIKNYQNLLAKDLTDQFTGVNTKQKVGIKVRQMNIDIFSNQMLMALTDYLF